MNKQLLVDISQIFYRCLFVQKQNVKDYGTDFLRHSMLQSLFKTIKTRKPDKVVIAWDSSKNWRYKVYSDYKKHRKEGREKHDIDWDKMFEFFDDFEKELRMTFPFLIIHQKYAEADDVIATICKHQRGTDVLNVIVSNDKDFKTLLRYDNVKLYDPIKNEFKRCSNPQIFLKSLILRGDKSDNVPHIAPRIGEKTAIKLAKNPKKLKEKLAEKDVYKSNLKRNSILINPKYIPEKIQKKIIKKYNSGIDKNEKSIFNYLKEHNLLQLMDQVDNINSFITNLR